MLEENKCLILTSYDVTRCKLEKFKLLQHCIKLLNICDDINMIHDPELRYRVHTINIKTPLHINEM